MKAWPLAILALQGTACTSSAAAPAPDGAAASERWIYVATSLGGERVRPSGGALERFGAAQDTRAVVPSPSGRLVAQALASEYVAVFDADGLSRGAADAGHTTLLGWSDDRTLLHLWRQGDRSGQLMTSDVDGRDLRTLPVPGALGVGYANVLLSPRRRWLAALATKTLATNTTNDDSTYALAILSLHGGAVVSELGTIGAGNFAWTGDDTLAFGLGGGANEFRFATPGAGPTAVTLRGADVDACAFASWYVPGQVIGGRPNAGTPLCTPVAVAVADGTTSPPSLPVRSPPLFALSDDGRQVAIAAGDELTVGPVDGSAWRALGRARDAIVAVGW